MTRCFRQLIRIGETCNLYYKVQQVAFATEPMTSGRNCYLAAALVRNKTIVRVAPRTNKTHPRAVRLYSNGEAACLHAEVNTLCQARPGDRIYVFRWLSNGEQACSAPCGHCIEQMKSAGISRVTYFNQFGYEETIRL